MRNNLTTLFQMKKNMSSLLHVPLSVLSLQPLEELIPNMISLFMILTVKKLKKLHLSH